MPGDGPHGPGLWEPETAHGQEQSGVLQGAEAGTTESTSNREGCKARERAALKAQITQRVSGRRERAARQAVGVLVDDDDARRAAEHRAVRGQDAHRACRMRLNQGSVYIDISYLPLSKQWPGCANLNTA